MKFHYIVLPATLCVAMVSSTAGLAGGAIGGSCCADLEERVAELEATTARKGNRKVSLTVYGQVHKALIFSDEGDGGKDVQIVDQTASQSRFGLTGKAKISSDLYAGYKIEFGVAADTGSLPLSLRHNDLYIGSKTFGKLSVGQGSTASDGIAEIDLSGTNYTAGGALNRGGIWTTGKTLSNLDGFSRKERVRYDSPSLAGFKVSASWQDNDDVDVALRYSQVFGDIKFAAGVAYFEKDTTGDSDIAGSASLFHTPSGLNLTVAGGDSEINGLEYWYVKAGIKRKIVSAGTTAFSIDYHAEELDSGAETDKVGFQIVQKIDAAAMEVYLSGWSTDSDLIGGDEDVLMLGSRIKF